MAATTTPMTPTTHDTDYDVIVVGARCAGSPTAMLLAQRGYRVLVVDRASFPSDTFSTHLLHAPAVAALRHWGLLDEVLASGCPPIERYSVDFGPFTIGGTPPPVDGSSAAYAPRRTVLDQVLVNGADRAGAEIRERFSVDEILVEDGTVTGIRGRGPDGRPVRERARVVIGADGRNSRVARAVQAERYHEKPMLMWPYYSYWSGLPTDGFETIVRPDRGWAAAPTNDGLTMLVVGWPIAEASAYRADVEANYLRTLELEPAFAERVRGATREAPFAGGASPNFFRRPYGPGWALVGDAGYMKDPITAQGIADAFRDAELCAGALDRYLSGDRPYAQAMAAYQQARDLKVLPIYELTAQLATLAPPPPELQQVLGAIHGNQPAMDQFLGVSAGIVSPTEFFSPEHLGPLLAA
jgi:flavin-dependent dehydrogenase